MNILRTGIGDPVSDQLVTWKLQHPNPPPFCTDLNGIHYPNLRASLAIVWMGHHSSKIAHFSSALPVSTVSELTSELPMPLVLGAWNLYGYADTYRDSRGFAVKFYTEDGNWDLVGNQIEVFGVRDPFLFGSLIRSRKRNPETGLLDPIMAWDFIQQRPETTHHILKAYSDINTPESLRSINGSGVHTFKLVDEQGDAVYCKFHFISHQKFELMSTDRQIKLAGSEPSFFRGDLYNAIAQQQYPRWTMALQVATVQQAESYRWDYLDVTKNWRLEDFPLIPVGILELNRNVKDFFSESEQSAFSPANLVPGIEPSADRMLHGRMFSYADAQRYRLGINGMMLPINKPLSHVASYERDGAGCFGPNGDGGKINRDLFHFDISFNCGAHGEFVVTNDISRYTKAKLFNGVGKTTPCFVRFSTVGGELGSADTAVDPHGFATKFYTEEGNYDLVGNDIEVFPIRDPMLFSDLNRSRKRNPLTHLKDANMWWDFVSLRPETSFHTLQLFSRHCASLTFQEAKDLQGTNPDYFIQDLYDSIESGNNPSWLLYIQVMTEEQAQAYPRNPFDITRNWRGRLSMIEVGRMTLTEIQSIILLKLSKLVLQYQTWYLELSQVQTECFMDVSYPTKILSDTVLEPISHNFR
ncbi:Catalase [Orchesella cincta]|uniref:Catalase n=1 Tax=Orchesella cincta TaxID=48709 RepID=A0A1D2MLH9_ORCCI|nr:Catalase [Orchesella cincta]